MYVFTSVLTDNSLYYHSFLLLRASAYLFLTIFIHTLLLDFPCPTRHSCSIVPYPILSYPILFCAILSCPVLSHPTLSYPTLSFSVLFSQLPFLVSFSYFEQAAEACCIALGAHTVIRETLDLLIPRVKGDLPGGDTFSQRKYRSCLELLNHYVLFYCN